jgi:hypothetical protein
MAIFTVHSRGEPERDAVFVADGFSWAALLFTGFWALWHRMWIVAAIVFAVMVAGSYGGLALGAPDELITGVNLALSLLLGAEAQDLRRWSLARRGFREIATVGGGNIEEAELRFFAVNLRQHGGPPAAGIPAPRVPPAADREPLGLFHPPG